jgi:hypothetical protein
MNCLARILLFITINMKKFKAQVQWLSYLFVLISLHAAKAALITANSGSFADVSSAVARATFGDTVQIPSGIWTWTNADLIISGITLQGAGTNETFIQDGLPPNPSTPFYLLGCVSTANFLTRITGITFQDVGGGTINYHGKVEVNSEGAGGSSSYRIDHCAFLGLQGVEIACDGQGVGLIDHCAFNYTDEAIISDWVSAYPGVSDQWGDISYATPPAYGTINVLCIENNYFQGLGESHAAYDGYSGARVTFRNNYLTNAVFANHGNDTSQRERSVREYEVYNNRFDFSYYDIAPFTFRGGTGVVFSNTITGPVGFNFMFSFRSVIPNTYGAANGQSPWDSNNVTVVSAGTAASAFNNVSPYILTVNGVNWTPNQWVGWSVINSNANWTPPIATPSFGIIIANGTNTLTLHGGKDNQVNFNSGDNLILQQCYAAIDQVGRGSGNLISGDNPLNTTTGTAAWPNEISEPLYGWANTLNGNPAGIASDYPNISENRDFYNSVKPGYTPLAYPHPLDVVDKKLSPPSGLSVQPISP